MSVVAISMVKDEADVIEHTVRHMLGQVDHVVVADNGSADGTRAILERLGVEVLDDRDPAYHQSQKMSRLAAYAALAHGAAWVVPFDADEVWYSPHGRIADVLAAHPDASVARAALYDHVATAEDPAGEDPTVTIGWRRRTAAEMPKVACRPCPRVTIAQGNHGAHYGATATDLLVVRHFPYRSAEQFVSKVRNGAAAYAATDLPPTEGQHWREYGALLDAQGPEALHDVFRRWFWSASPSADPTLIYDPCPR